MTYDNLALALVQESTYNIEDEINNFNKICESINILNENGILLEAIDKEKILEIIKNILIKIKTALKTIVDKIKEFIGKIKDFLEDKIGSIYAKILNSDNKLKSDFEYTFASEKFIEKTEDYIGRLSYFVIKFLNSDLAKKVALEVELQSFFEEITSYTDKIENDKDDISEKTVIRKGASIKEAVDSYKKKANEQLDKYFKLSEELGKVETDFEHIKIDSLDDIKDVECIKHIASIIIKIKSLINVLCSSSYIASSKEIETITYLINH